MIIDSHAHLHDEKFSADLYQVLDRARSAGIDQLITIGCDLETTTKARACAQAWPKVYFSAGFHPHEAKLLHDESLNDLKSLATDKKCVAIGECGLDFYYLHSSKIEQEYAFIKQIELAHELNLPLVIHLRDAFLPCVNILENHLKDCQKVLIHCFSGMLDEAKIFIEMGCLISLSGIVTFKKPGDLLNVAREIPLNHLLIETDCPYLAPHPYRGQRNEPAYIVKTLEAVASARSEPYAEVQQAIYQNSRDFFGLEDN